MSSERTEKLPNGSTIEYKDDGIVIEGEMETRPGLHGWAGTPECPYALVSCNLPPYVLSYLDVDGQRPSPKLRFRISLEKVQV
jgi:hypothetical protein